MNSTLRPLVTIGVSNYNYGKYVHLALDSIAAQSYPNLEIIIVDDSSNDDSANVIETWMKNYRGNANIRFMRNEANRGIVYNTNLLIEAANGKYIQLLDADDIIIPQKIEQQVALLEAGGANVAFAYANVTVINEAGVETEKNYFSRIGYDERTMPSGQIFESVFKFNIIPFPSTLVRTESLRAIGLIPENATFAQDYYVWLRLTEMFEAVYQPGVNAFYRVHTASATNSSSTRLVSFENVLKIKMNYLKAGSKQMKDHIKHTLSETAPYLYKMQFPTSLKWLFLNFKMNPGFRTFILFLMCRIGVPYSVWERIKSLSR